MSKLIKLISFFSILALLISACGLQNEPVAPAQNIGAPMPQPAKVENQAIGQVLSIGDYTETSLNAQDFQLTFKETGGNNGAGSAESQKLVKDGSTRFSSCYTYGTIDGATYETCNYGFDKAVKMKVNANIFSLFTEASKYLTESSNLILVYENTDSGYLLKEAQYQEMWLRTGKQDQDALAMGVFAKWDESQTRKIIPIDYHKWGFWEKRPTLKDQTHMVVAALDSAKTGLVNVKPAYLAVDQDSIKELIGRQSGLKLYRNGQEFGSVSMEYGNWLNGLVGSESLSLININVGKKQCKVVIMKSAFSPVDSWVYIFTCDQEFAQRVMKLIPEQWPSLYAGLSADEYPVIAAVHVAGNIDPITATFAYTDKTDSGTINKTSSTQLGRQGGRLYSTFTDYSPERLYTASQLLAVMGKGGITSLGISFISNGSGLNYYLLSEVVAKSKPGTKLGSLSRIDMVGDLDIAFIDQFAK